jgi:hypothetical protein
LQQGEKIGEGCFGTVFKGIVALKRLNSEAAIAQEAEILSASEFFCIHNNEMLCSEIEASKYRDFSWNN